jgi:type IV pilus assembly protein PilA
VKQCPSCKGNLADFVEVCPYCGAATPLASALQYAPQPEWGSPAGGPPQNSGKALASLICGVVFFFWPLSIAAIVLGHLALADIKRSAGRLTGRGMAIGGLVTGYIGASIIPFLIIAAIAIPNLLRSRMAANEASAVGSLRTYNTALVSYAQECPNQGYPPSLAYLGPGAAGADKCTRADLLDRLMGQEMPVKSGYRFFYAPESYDSTGHVVKYALAADPVTPGTTGARHFFTDESGVIRFSRRGGADAHSEPLQ